MENHAENVDQRLLPDPFLTLVNNPKKWLRARNSFKNKIFWKRIIKEPSKSRLYIFFWTQSLLMDKVFPKKWAWNYWPVTLQVTKQVQKNSFISYILSDQVWRYNIKWFLSYSKNYICKFMQANSWHYELFHFHLPFWVWKVWKRRDKKTKIWISRERKELFRQNKKHFS